MPAKRSAPRLNQTIAASHQTELPPLHVPKVIAGFVDFVRTQGVVGLAVGFVVGTAASTLIKSVVTNLINPIVGLATGGINLSAKTVCLNSAHSICKNTLNYGQLISDIITFMVILAVVYFVVKGLKLDKLDKAKEDSK
jgi:large conductance mechanosensitive channel